MTDTEMIERAREEARGLNPKMRTMVMALTDRLEKALAEKESATGMLQQAGELRRSRGSMYIFLVPCGRSRNGRRTRTSV